MGIYPYRFASPSSTIGWGANVLTPERRTLYLPAHPVNTGDQCICDNAGTLCPQTQFLDAEEASAAAGACLITMKREMMDVGKPEGIEIPASQDEVNHYIQIQEETSVEITVKREKVDIEESEVIEIPASKEEVDYNIQIQERTSLEDHLADAEVNMPSEEEVEIKDDCDTHIPQMKVRLGGKVLQEQGKES
ncbi:uncharacterized protein [Hetaerina americana]|uniref:uncharacterized protein n=1 Tax=Hetaerina americana TaxID=62018 RepID=UPI003A7F5593